MQGNVWKKIFDRKNLAYISKGSTKKFLFTDHIKGACDLMMSNRKFHNSENLLLMGSNY